MAAGSALIGLCRDNSEVANIIEHHKCGKVVEPGDVNAMFDAILALAEDRNKLNFYKANSRKAAERHYSRKNTTQYLEALSNLNTLQ
jgi:glycosyltransferase involved in cell wall biosynthesis